MSAVSLHSISPQPMQLEELLAAVEGLTGLEVSIYPARSMVTPESIHSLPPGYRRHMSAFCRLVKGREGQGGCRGHDALITNLRAGEIGHAFVQRCHAGAAEVIVPVFGDPGHLATVFIGQVVTEPVESDGFEGIWRRVRSSTIEQEEMRRVFAALPRLPERELLLIGQLVECALRGMAEQMSAEMLERQVRIQSFPQISRALRLLERDRCWGISQAQMAERVHLSVAYFSRLFKRVIGHTFTDYLTSLRMREAQNLLHMTRLPVSEIARQLGYSRQSYFTRRFRRVTGMTPSGYRRNRR